jgi:hypothetical protein
VLDEEDVAALRRYWRFGARRWWSTTWRLSGICDACNRRMVRYQGYLVSGSRLECKGCLEDHLDGALEKLRANPSYFGDTELRDSRRFRAR